jgi:uncharacterized protein YbjT (DUF2867 family)
MFPVLLGSLKRSTRLQLVAADDIGVATAAIVQDPSTWIGTAVDVAGDWLRVQEMRDIYREVTGRRAKGFPLPIARLIEPDFHRQLQWNKATGWTFPFEGSTPVRPEPTRWANYLRMTGLRNLSQRRPDSTLGE